jgi:hypothetical protein
MMRKFTLLFAAACFAMFAARASACSIVDATGAFWPLAARSANMTPAAQAAAFRKEVVAKFPNLYTDPVLGSGNIKSLDELAVAWLAIAGKKGIDGRVVERDLMRNIPVILARFQKTFPDFRCNFPIYLMASLGSLDGAGRFVDGRPALVLGIDTMAKYDPPPVIPVLIAHELFHRYNFQAAGFSDDPGERQAIWRTLWAEGLATYMSGFLNSQASPGEILDSAELALQAPPLIRRLAAALRDNDTPDLPRYAEYFEGGSAKARAEGIPARAGYYVGYRVVLLLARRYTPYQLAHLKGPALHRKINDALDMLAGKG